MDKTKTFFHKAWVVLGVITKRFIPVATFIIFFIILAAMVDRYTTLHRPAEDYIRYYSFNVQNAREGEDVNFTICRAHDQNYNYNGSLSIYVLLDAKDPNKDAQVFSKDIGGALRPGECENKVLLASEFHHAPGKYKMYFTITFREPKYQYEKSTSFTSNVYTVYPEPTELNAKIEYLEQQLEQLRRQRDDANVLEDSTNSSMVQPGNSQPSSSQQSPPPANVQPNTPRQTREVCDPLVNLLGIRIGQTNCRQEEV